jgi:PIN domain nuclease of toxin-antitoxin system
MDMGLVAGTHEVQAPAQKAVILLDTHAAIWLHDHRPRADRLVRADAALYVSPATALELQVLAESGRLRLRRDAVPREIMVDDRWVRDDPPAIDWFNMALHISWTRDLFDRLLVAHAKLRRWRLATADALILEHLAPGEYLEL